MKITAQQIKHLAKLGRLELKTEEIKQYQKDLSEILAYVSKLAKWQLLDKDSQSSDLESRDFLREDKVNQYQNPDDLIKQAPLEQDRFIKVNAVK